LRLSSLDQLNKPDWVTVIATQDWYVAFGYFLDHGWSIALVHDRIFRVEGAYGNPCLAAGVFLPHARLSSHMGKLPWKMDRFLFSLLPYFDHHILKEFLLFKQSQLYENS
jgi:hypothetical protein